MRIRDLAAVGNDLPDRLEGTYYGTAWSADERYLLYTRPDHAMRPYQVRRHEVGAAQGDDVLVYEEPDERYNVDLELCRSGAVRHHHERGQHLDGRAGAPGHPAAGRAIARGRAPAGRRVPAGPLGRPLRHPHQPRRPGLQDRQRALLQPGAGRVGRPRAPPGRAGASRRSSRSSATSCCTSGPTRSSASASSAATAPSGRWPSTTRSTPSPSAPTPSTTRRRCGSPTSRCVTPSSVYDYDVATSAPLRLLKRTPVLQQLRDRRLRRDLLFGGPADDGEKTVPIFARLRGAGSTRPQCRCCSTATAPTSTRSTPLLLDRPALPAWPGRQFAVAHLAAAASRPVLGPRRQAPPQAQHLHRLHRLRRAPGGAGLRRTGPATARGAGRRLLVGAVRCGPSPTPASLAGVPFVDSTSTTMLDWGRPCR